MKALWCKLVGHKWKRRYYPGLDAEKHDCRRCKASHWDDQTNSKCPWECFVEPAAW